MQLNIFESYFEDLNQQYRLPQNDTEYSNRIENLEQKLQYFQRTGTTAGTNPFTLVPTDVYRVGSVFYKGVQLTQYAQRNEITQLLLSPLTQPNEKFPLYLYEDEKLYLYPSTIQSGVTVSYLRKPNNVVWNYTTGAQGQYIYSPTSSQDFELDISEQTEIILRILAYSGVIIQAPSIIQIASQAVATEENNEKS